MSKFIDLTGQRFGRFVVIKQTKKDKFGNRRWLCLCDCGKEKIVLVAHLRSGATKSCGCLNKEIITKHGHNRIGKQTGIYQSWYAMIQRCTNPNHKNWKSYGGRGITVCKRWLKFKNFLEDMKECPSELTIERNDKNGNYCPENCRWATRKEQARNKRNSRYVTYKGKRWLFIELCEKYKMPYNIVYSRYYIHGWTLKRALTEPVKKRRKRNERDSNKWTQNEP